MQRPNRTPSADPSAPPRPPHRRGSSVGRGTAFLLLAVFGALALAGCKVTADDVDYWRRTVKGPTKLVRVMQSDHYDIALRARAATALVEMERNDVEGLALLQDSLQLLRSQDAEVSAQIVAAMAPRLLELMSGQGSPEAAQTEQGAPPRIQTRAKDAAYLVIPYSQGETTQQLMTAVVDWYVADFVNRSLEGNYSVEQVVRSLGAPAAGRLLQALNAHMPQQALVKIAELIGQIGDAATKASAATRLVAIQREMESDAFLEWLKGEIRTQMSAGGSTPDAARVEAVARLNRENWINDGAITAMRHLSSQDAVRNRLMEVASTKPAAGLPAPIIAERETRRMKAILALEGAVAETHIPALFTIALDTTNDAGLRDAAFDRIGDVRSTSSIPRLWPLVESAANEDMPKRIRGRAGQLVLAAGGTAIVPEFLRRLPSAEGTEFEHAELSGYALRMSQMTNPPTELMARQLTSPRWVNRAIALFYFQRRGTAADIPRLEARRSDTLATAGDNWTDLEPDGTTIGRVAETALRGLRERLTAEAGQPDESEADGDAAADSSMMAAPAPTMAP